MQGNSVLLTAAVTACQLGHKPETALALLQDAQNTLVAPDLQVCQSVKPFRWERK